jgi:hypothetical protein
MRHLDTFCELQYGWTSTRNLGVSELRDERTEIRRAITETWERYSALHFLGWAPCGAAAINIRISIADVRPHTEGLGSEINNQKSGMVLNVVFAKWSPSCKQDATIRKMCIRAIAVHEFGHALAFAHEQNRTDKDEDCSMPADGPNGDKTLTPYDPDSVMNYCNPQYNNFGKLSYKDVISVRSIYGAPPNTPANG